MLKYLFAVLTFLVSSPAFAQDPPHCTDKQTCAVQVLAEKLFTAEMENVRLQVEALVSKLPPPKPPTEEQPK